MSPTSKSRKRKRRAQLLAGRPVAAGEKPRGVQASGWSAGREFDDWLLMIWTARVTGVLFAVAGAILAVLTIVSVHAVDEMHAYQHAPVCDASAANTSACRQEVSVVVTARGTSGSRKSPVYYIDVSGLPQTPARIEMPDGSGVWAIAQYGDEATVELWHGTPVSVTDGYWTSETSGSPGNHMVKLISFGIFALVVTAMLALYWLRIHEVDRGHGDGWTRRLVPLEPVAMFAAVGFLIGAMFGWSTESVVGTVAVGGGFTLVAAAGSAVNGWRMRRRRM